MSSPSFVPSVAVLPALNALLRRESWASTALAEYAGKTVLFRLASKKIFQAAISSAGMLESCDDAVVADVILDMPFSDLAEILSVFRTKGADGIAKQMQIHGDAGLAQLLGELARNLRWDAQADLARVFGDIAAVRITGLARLAFNGIQDGSRRLHANLQEYLLNESKLAVKNSELHTFKNSLNDIQQRLDRLDARLEKLTGI